MAPAALSTETFGLPDATTHTYLDPGFDLDPDFDRDLKFDLDPDLNLDPDFDLLMGFSCYEIFCIW